MAKVDACINDTDNNTAARITAEVVTIPSPYIIRRDIGYAFIQLQMIDALLVDRNNCRVIYQLLKI